MEDETPDAVTDALSNIPGIGPARKAALYAAGITTRAALAQASADQLISLTGMPRGQAEKALEALHATESPGLSAPSPQIAPPLEDEAMPTSPPPAPPVSASADAPALPDDDQNPVTAERGMLDNAAFRAKTALSDATRVWDLSELEKPLARLAAALDSVSEKAENVFRPKAAKRLTAQLGDFSQWLEKAISENKPLKEKRREQVRQRLKSERIEIEEAVRAALRRQDKREINAVKDVPREPKKRKKRIK
ncbi:MAG: helix-hairpin-helix domain-containing protein [Armatimonadota bacterium]